MVRAQHRGAAHGVHRQRRLPPRHEHRHLRLRPRADDPGADRPRRPAPATSPGPATSSRCATARAACSSGPATPRPRSTWPAWPGLYPAGVLCEIVNDDGTMARVPDLERFCEEHGLLMISIADLIRYRRQNEKLVRRVAEARIPTDWGDFTCYAYESLLDGEQHVALVRGAVQGEDDVLVRVHSECLTGDVFGSLRCDCGIAARRGDGEDRRGGAGRRRLPARPRGARHRHRPQAAGLQPAGRGPRHGRRQRRARACPSTAASTASARRSSSTSASPRCG